MIDSSMKLTTKLAIKFGSISPREGIFVASFVVNFVASFLIFFGLSVDQAYDEAYEKNGRKFKHLRLSVNP